MLPTWLRTPTSVAGPSARRKRTRRASAFWSRLEELERRVVLSSSLPLDSLIWADLGPAPITNGQIPGAGNVSGRITGLSADPRDPNVIYAASAGGGVWKTINGGTTWNPLTDFVTDGTPARNPIPEFMGAVAVAPSNSQVVYAGTGEADNSGDSYYGEGILVSRDGGATWTLTAQAQLNGLTISRIAVDPLNSSTAYATVSTPGINGKSGGTTGIYKTTNGGANWSNLTQAAGMTTTDEYSDLVLDPTTSGASAVLYAAIGTSGGSNANGVYESTDGGSTWSKPLPLPSGATDGRIALTLDHFAGSSQPTLFASIASAATSNLLNLERSSDGGASWADLTPNLGGDDYLKGQGNYDNVVIADPNNPGLVYVAGVLGKQGPVSFSGGGVLESVDMGQTWTEINMGTGGNNGPHTDYHALTFDAAGRLLAGNDGGVWRLDNNDLRTPNIAWTDLNTNLEITQLTSVALSPNSPDGAYSGSQDNGSEFFSDSRAWIRNRNGDGGVVRVDPNDFQTLYHTYSYPPRLATQAFLEESDQLPSFWFENDQGIPRTDNANFYPPFVLDPNNSKRLLLGTDQLYEELHDGTGWHAFGTPLPSAASRTAIDQIAIAPSDSNTIYVTAGNAVYVTTDNGTTWSARTPVVSLARLASLPGSSGSYFLGLAIDPADENTAYVVTSTFTSDGTGEVWQTTNAGRNWTDITGIGLPNGPVNTIALAPAFHEIFVGTNVGVYGTTAATGASTPWRRVGAGMPDVSVVDLETALYPGQDGVLAAATYGRGLWELQLQYPIHITSLNAPSDPTEGVPFNPRTLAVFSDADPNPNINDFSAEVIWGDGTSSTLTAANGGIVNNFDHTFSLIVAPHTYVEESPNAVFSLVVRDCAGGSDFRVVPITILDVSATFSFVTGNPVGVVEGLSTGPLVLGIVRASGTPEELAEITASVSWGDGTEDTLTLGNGGIVTNPDGTFTLVGRHTYAEDGLTQSGLNVFIADSTSASGTVNVPFKVEDAPVTVTAASPPVGALVGEDTGLIDIAEFTDANPLADVSDYSVTVHWGDATSTLTSANSRIVPEGNGRFRVLASHTYQLAGPMVFSVSVADAGGASDASQDTLVTVDYPAPVLTGLSTGAVDEGSGSLPLKLTGSQFFFSSLVQFNGTTIDTTYISPTVLTATIPAADLKDSGTASLTVVNLTPGGGRSNAQTFVIRNVPPTASLLGPGQGVPGQPLTFTLSAVDVSPADQAAGFRYTVDWGDGTPAAPDVQVIDATPNNGAGLSVSHIYAQTGTYPVELFATDQDGGRSPQAAALTTTISNVVQQGANLSVGGNGNIQALSGSIIVVLNGQRLGEFLGVTGSILIYGSPGNDTIFVDPRIANPVTIYGDGGTDVLEGGGGTNTLVGGAGSTTYLDNGGTNLIIPGTGTNTLVPAGGINTFQVPTGAAPLLTVTANAATRPYGQANPLFSVSYSGFAPGDGPGTLGGTLSDTTPATAASPPGGYAITPSGLTASQYTLVFVAGKLTVAPAPLVGTGVNASATAGAPFRGVVARFVNSDPFGGPGSYTAAITWGDGSVSAGVITDQGGGTFAVSGVHTYADPGSDSISVRIQHNLGYTLPVMVSSTATVAALGLGVRHGLAGGTGFWHNPNGQALIDGFNGGPNATALSSWLATSFPNLYGAAAAGSNLTGFSNARVAAFYESRFALSGPNPDAEVLATALNVYATTQSLGGTAGQPYGFTVTATGLGADSLNVADDGAAFDAANNTTRNVFQLLRAVDRQAVAGVLYNGDKTLLNKANDLLDALSQAGAIS